MGWVVSLVKSPVINDFRSDFFPRKFRYKKDALELAVEVKNKGGIAKVDKDESRPNLRRGN